MRRPFPPEELQEYAFDDAEGVFVPAPEIVEWVLETFLDSSSPLYNADHHHLTMARLGALWTNVEQEKGGVKVRATAEMPTFQGTAWQRTRQKQQMREWFGFDPDFVLTFDAPHAAAISDRRWCRTAEHELWHCGLKNFSKKGPVWMINKHPVEVFPQEVERYGAAAAGEGVVRIVEAARFAPAVDDEDLEAVCGTCLAAAT